MTCLMTSARIGFKSLERRAASHAATGLHERLRLFFRPLAFAALACAAAPAALAEPAAGEASLPIPPNGPGLTVAILDLATAPDLMPPPAPVVRPAWRTSFGSERQTAPAPKPSARDQLAASLEGADVVLIQGVGSVRPLRRLFPPRHWRLIVSRSAAAKSVAQAPEPIAMTAIAVKARPELRVTARAFALRHFPSPSPVAEAAAVAEPAEAAEAPTADTASDDNAVLATPVSGTIDDVVAASVEAANVSIGLASSPRAPETATAYPATAVRLVSGERAIWLAAVALPRACAAEDPPCAAHHDLDLWQNAKRDASEPALIGSLMNSDASADPAKAGCAAYSIEADFGWQRLSSEAGGISPEPGKGCIVTLRIPL